ncbi:DUF3103 domain-containing protein [Streptomyces pimonensis]|uniref:DUF3103 domain-containing protein n=1 Tax=Streptomyces pimonensis TaxID=2860288 RepID=A0ABV4J730_9ACTN
MRISKTAMRAMIPLATSAVLLSTAGVGSAAVPAGPAGERASAHGTDRSVTAVTDQLAKQFAGALGARDVERQVRESVNGGSGSTDLADLADRTRGLEHFARQVDRGNAAVLQARGLQDGAGSLIELRLGDDSMRDQVRKGEPLLVAGEADEDADTITAYDSRGRVHRLDARTVPGRVVLVVGIDGEKSLQAGLAQLRETLAQHGVNADVPAAAPGKADRGAGMRASGGYDATMMESARLKDDMEPWHKGGAEIYALVAGVNPNGQPQVDTVEMPYLDHDGETYNPHQILVNWSHFKFNAADVVMMEEDDTANYAELARTVAKALLVVIQQGQYVPLVEAVINAIPQGWFSDDHDYVDSWYTVQRHTAGQVRGAAGNGTLNLAPFYVGEL